MGFERRSLMDEDVTIRQEEPYVVAHGYAARFNRLSQNLGGFVEQIAPGAFTKTLKEQDIRALFNHSEDNVLGRMSAGTLSLTEDDEGLSYEIRLPDTTVGRDLAVLLERGDISGSSFGFRTLEDDWSETEQGYPLRTLRAVSARDIGPVTFPAYVDSTSALRSLAETRNLDLVTLVAAAGANELRSLIFPTDDETDDRVPPIVHRHRWIA